MVRPRHSPLPAASTRPTRAPDEEPTISGEYRSVRPPPALRELAPPSGRYGMAPESRRVLDEYDFDFHALQGLELEDEHRRSSHEPLPPASMLPRVEATPRSSGPRRSASAVARESRRTVLLAACFVLCAMGLVAATGLVIALLAPT